MSRYWKIMGYGYLSLFLILGSVLTVKANDQPPTGTKGPDAVGKGMNRGWEADPVKMMEKRLGLSKGQSAKIKELFINDQGELKLLMDRFQVDRATLQLKVDSKAPEEEIKALLDVLAADQKQLDVHRHQFEEKLRVLLSLAQQAIFVLDITGGPLEGPWMNPWRDEGKGANLPPPPPSLGQAPDSGGSQ